MSNNLAAFTLRLPSQLHTDIKAAAKTNRRSVNSEVVARLENTFMPSQTSFADNKNKGILFEYVEALGVKIEELESELAIYKRKRSL
ncbi:Arc family DNA-binding protein [Pseudomonas yamanorum]|uniref:Arc family DNA-binding protein n=1 Tax=Pseudomonas yamanorum TaxID=515393 RepID=UPI002ED03223|nr:Arc family DNA-binding protein [Pseudomonas yamanorum]